MKTDKELLELAAKAAGTSVLDHEYDDALGFTYRLSQCQEAIDSFNPLNDDGDALRLAVKLGNWSLMYSDDDWEYCDHDGYAATRRAIVRAAAAIGESK